EGHFAITHDARSGKGLHRFELFAKGLDHNFFGIVDAVDDQPELPPIGLQHHQVDRAILLADGTGIGCELQFAVEIDEGQQAAAQPVDRRAMNQFDALAYLVGLDPHQLKQADLWDGVAIAPACDYQRGDDRQRQRNLYPDRGALPGSRLNVDVAANVFHVGLHHIHAHPAAGDIRHLFRSGKSWKKNKIEDLALVHASRLIGGDHATVKRLLPDAFGIKAGAIVGDLD